MTMFLLILACIEPKSQPEELADILTETAFFTSVSMDYSVGSMSSVSVDLQEINEDLATVSGDPIIRLEGGYLWQLNRYQYDTIRKYDPLSPNIPLQEISVAPAAGSANPHDVAICQDKLFVSLYEQSEILVVEPDTMLEIERIDISDFADNDGKTEASSLVVLNNTLYLGLEGLNRTQNYAPIGSQILAIDCSALEVMDSVDFGWNIQLFDWTDEQLLVLSLSETGESSVISSFAPETGEFTEILAFAEIITDLSIFEETISFLSYENIASTTSVNCFREGNIRSSEGFLEYLTDIQANSLGEFWVTAHWGWIDPTLANTGIYRFDSNCEPLQPEVLELNLAPNSLVFFQP